MNNSETGFISKAPKIELHLHLEGAGRKETVRELNSRAGSEWSAITPDSVEKIDRYQGLSHFIITIRTLMDTCFRTPEDYERIAFELFEDLAAQNVIYTEVSFDPIRGLRVGIPYDEILSAVYSAKVRAEGKYNIKVGLIVGLGREIGPQIVEDFSKKAAESIKYGVIGLDLHGNESAVSADKFSEAFKIAKSAGLGLRAHAGEGSGPESIWSALELGVTRIGHGVRAIEDPLLMEHLKKHGITLDMCPTSNYRLGIVTSLKEHPIRSFYDNKIPVTISTDDPFFFNTSITNEYEVLSSYMNFNRKELKDITLNSVEAAFLTDVEKNILKSEIFKYY